MYEILILTCGELHSQRQRAHTTWAEQGFLFLGSTDYEKRPETRMTNVSKTGCYSCDLKSYGEPFQA